MKIIQAMFCEKIKRLLNPAGSMLMLAAMFCAFVGLTTNVTAQNVKPDGGGTIYTISGNVQADGANLENAAVVLLLDNNVFGSAQTDTNGNYSLGAVGELSYKLSVYKEGYNFNPSYQIVNNISSNQIVNFQNGTLLCIPAPVGQSGGGFCENSSPTPISRIVNGIIAFEIFGNTFGIEPDGTNQMQIPPAGSFPSWSFDGTKLLYNRTTSLDPDQEIYITNADSTGFRQITFNFVNDYRAQFSPDGTRAVFYRYFNSSDVEILTINTDSPNNGINEIQLTDDDCLNQDPTYSPDGTLIAFAKICENESLSGIYTMNSADGSEPFQLTSGEIDYSPAWRPDGGRIVFVRDGDIWAINPSGTGIAQVTFDLQFPYYSPVYSPDGEKIAFSRVPSALEFQEIYTLQLSSGFQTRVTTNQTSFNKEYPSWQKIVAEVSTNLIGGVNLIFSTVTSGGNTVATPIDPNSAGALPDGFTPILESAAFDVRTSANYTGDIEICFDVMNINDPTLFAELVIFHNENGALVDRTSSRDFDARRICATVSSLSPFVIAAPNAPTAASVTIAGRILTNDGNSLAKATVLLTDSNGNTRTVRTSSFGYYRFDEVEAGQTYVFEIRSKRYQFAPQTISVYGNLTDLNFYAAF